VLSWRVAKSLDVQFCIEALEEAVAAAKPEIFNTDQGSLFASPRFAGMDAVGGGAHLDGRTGTLDGQCVYRAVLAQSDIRMHLPAEAYRAVGVMKLAA
jgi:putative transposase